MTGCETWRRAALGMALLAGGCNWGGGGGGSAARTGDQRLARPTGAGAVAAPVEDTGAGIYNQVNVEFHQDEARLGGILKEKDEPSDEPVRQVSSTVRQVVDGTKPDGQTQPTTTQPTSAPDGAEAAGNSPVKQGTYYTIGGVVAEVNGQPIYANRVLNILARALQAKAHEDDRPEFMTAARDLIENQIDELIRAEILFAAAQRNLSPEEKMLAQSMTMAWRNSQITAAGGSLQQAMRQAADRGEDFEQLVQEQYRLFMTQVYVQKKLMPRVQLSANDLRRYYQEHIDQFTQFDEASFRVIRIDPKKMESRDAALDRITTLWRQLQRGEADFAKVAGQINHDAFLMKNNGQVPGPVQRGSYRQQAVEDAVWKTPVGAVTDIVTGDDGAFYIALVESKQQGRVMAFEEENVQESIRETLRSQQLRTLMDQARQKLAENASVRRDPGMVEVAVEMASQNYDRWRATAPPTPDKPAMTTEQVIDTLLPPDTGN